MKQDAYAKTSARTAAVAAATVAVGLAVVAAALLLRAPSSASAEGAPGVAASADVIWTTATGSKYHRESCPRLSERRASLPLTDAVSRGLSPCKVCSPPEPEGPYRVAGLRASSEAELSRLVRGTAAEVVDGDTFRFAPDAPAPAWMGKTETVRLLGVDTPETVHPTKGEEPFGREASDFAKATLAGRRVALAFDRDLRDRYGRLLAYAYLEDGSCFNALLVRRGFSPAYLKYPFAFELEFRGLEDEARGERVGLWARP